MLTTQVRCLEKVERAGAPAVGVKLGLEQGGDPKAGVQFSHEGLVVRFAPSQLGGSEGPARSEPPGVFWLQLPEDVAAQFKPGGLYQLAITRSV